MTNRFFILFIAIVLSGIAVTVISNRTVSAADNYKGPLDLAATKDGSKIYVALFDAHEIAVLNVSEDKIVQTISVGKEPTGIVLSPDEKTLYVTSGGDRGLLQAVDLATGHVVYEVVAGHTPMSPVITPDGKKMFVCNRFNNDVGEYDLPELKCVRRINVIREPRGAVITNNGKTVYVVNALPNDVLNIPEDFEAMIDAAAEVSAIDVVSGTVKNIRLPNGSGNLHGICISPDGRYVYLTEVLGRYMMPATQIERGWMNTNAISILDTTQLDTKHSGLINTVLIDDVDLGAANLWGITVSDDGKQLFITAAGINELIIVDAEAMHKKLSLLPQEDSETIKDPTVKRILFNGVPNDLAFLAGMKKRVRLDGKGARPVVAVGNNVYVGIYYSDTLQKIDLTVSE
ncbi:MAG: YncE family protein, partial [Planctomycetaceae bacterium]|nr:YncE family protein [Planctomycetaceae bacterium]